MKEQRGDGGLNCLGCLGVFAICCLLFALLAFTLGSFVVTKIWPPAKINLERYWDDEIQPYVVEVNDKEAIVRIDREDVDLNNAIIKYNSEHDRVEKINEVIKIVGGDKYQLPDYLKHVTVEYEGSPEE